MLTFIETLKSRNEVLFWFGAINLLAALAFLVLSKTSSLEVKGINAWYKPLKFALSTTIFSLSMGWYMAYLEQGKAISAFNWIIVITLGFEVLYIGIQAGRGELSHYNMSSPFYSFMYSMMALAATVATLATAYIGFRFFTEPINDLPDYYLWAIRFGIILFVIFSFEGFVMGSRMSHTIGGPDGEQGLPFLNWSRKYGDPRVAHFIGMHALQVLPLLSFYLLKNTVFTFISAAIYGLIAFYVLAQALWGKPFI